MNLKRKTHDPKAEQPFDAGLDLDIEAIDLIHKVGSQRSIERTVTTTQPVGDPEYAVGVGKEITVQARFESVEEGIYVSGSATGEVAAECSRCLDPLSESVTANFDELFSYPEKVPAEEKGEVPELVADHIHLGPLVHDAFAVAAPYQPLCSPDCLGLCSECGIRLEEDPEHAHDFFDPRFAALAGFFGEHPNPESENEA